MKKISKQDLVSAKPHQAGKLTPALRAQLQGLRNRRDQDIDYSDIPVTTAADWKHATRGALYRPLKQQVTVRVDADVLAWLREQGSGYQSRMNGILRDAMLKSL
jgi:uncharacterized protein (DUF4415 family)